MPLYEFECDACGERFELIRKFSDPPVDTCARCGRGPVRRLQSSPAIQFKGSGWYVTDYAGKSGGDKQGGKTADGKAADGDTAGGSKTDTGAKPSADGAPAAKSDTGTKPAAGSSTTGESKS